LAFQEIGITNWSKYIKQNKLFMRPAEVNILIGDPTKAETELKWNRKVNFKQLVKKMVANDLKIESTKL
jgi:GDPmannose 4,6-dehydratase